VIYKTLEGRCSQSHCQILTTSARSLDDKKFLALILASPHFGTFPSHVGQEDELAWVAG